MLHKSSDGERLLLLTLTLEAAVVAEDWAEVSQLLTARATLIDTMTAKVAEEIASIDERILTTLRQRLRGVRADLRNLSAALKIAGPYLREQQEPSLSLAG